MSPTEQRDQDVSAPTGDEDGKRALKRGRSIQWPATDDGVKDDSEGKCRSLSSRRWKNAAAALYDCIGETVGRAKFGLKVEPVDFWEWSL